MMGYPPGRRDCGIAPDIGASYGGPSRPSQTYAHPQKPEILNVVSSFRSGPRLCAATDASARPSV
jgi:hypothetical protein